MIIRIEGKDWIVEESRMRALLELDGYVFEESEELKETRAKLRAKIYEVFNEMLNSKN